MKKYVIIAIIGILIIILGINFYKQNEYQKYCQDCSRRHVTFTELEDVKRERKLDSIEQILNYQEHISNQFSKISNRNLTENEKSRLDNAVVKVDYDENKTYDLNQIIKMEADYKTVSDELDKLEHDNSERTYKAEIKIDLETIKADQDIINGKKLTIRQNEQFKALNLELDNIDYDENFDYEIGTLGEIKREIKTLKNKFNNLVENV